MSFEVFIPPQAINFKAIFNLLRACSPEGLFFMKAKPCDKHESFFAEGRHPEILEEFEDSTLALLFVEGTPEEINQVHQFIDSLKKQRDENSSKITREEN